MHCVAAAEIAALIAQHGPTLVYRREMIPQDALSDYWVSSKSRLELWHRAIARNRDAHLTGDWLLLQRWWTDHMALLEEILVTDMLTRVIATLAAWVDHVSERMDHPHDATGDATPITISPITHTVHLSHLEVRNRVLQLMLDNRGCAVVDAVRLNRLRRTTERWSDGLIGRMHVDRQARSAYAFDRALVDDYAREGRSADPLVATTLNPLMNAAMRDTLVRRTEPHAALPQANRAVAASVLAMLPPAMFDGLGTILSLRNQRIAQDHHDDSTRCDDVLDRLGFTAAGTPIVDGDAGDTSQSTAATRRPAGSSLPPTTGIRWLL